MDYFKENLQAIKNNQAFLAPEKRLKPTKDPLVSFVDSGKFLVGNNNINASS